jgi:DNA-directed RNA polymerase beta subunit
MGRVHSLTGVQYDGTAFHDHLSIEESMRLLEEYGWSSTGKEDYYMPKTGKIIQAQVFSGFCHYYPLEHKAQPKLQVRYIGKSNARTHQSVTGIENGGGQREGHMEHDVIRTHGASDIIVQWATRASDYYVIYTCAKCDTQIYPHRIDNVTVFMCPECQASVKDVKYAPCCVVTECLRKYSENMGCHLSYVLRPKASLYLPTLTDNIREKK